MFDWDWPFKENPPIFESQDVAGSTAFLKKYGICITRAPNDSIEARGRFILEQWRKIILTQPWAIPIKVRNAQGRILDIDDDEAEFLHVVTSPLSAEDRKEFARAWPLHRGFGACSDDSVFHLHTVWDIRQHPEVYDMAVAVIGKTDLWVDINRCIQKLPGEGDAELLHVDADVHDFISEDYFSTYVPVVQGKYCATPSRFVCCPGSNTAEFWRSFGTHSYVRDHGWKRGAAKCGFKNDTGHPDPMGIWDHRMELVVQPGCIVRWLKEVIHGTVENPLSSPINYGFYLGYWMAGSRPRYYEKSGVEERSDRVNSFTHGLAMKLWPSYDKVQFYPLRFQNFHNLLLPYHNKLPVGHPSIAYRWTKEEKNRKTGIVTKEAKLVPHLLPWIVQDYVMPNLTSLGRKLVGLDRWPGEPSDVGSKRVREFD